MTVFDHYARYYDLLYRDKDYAAEAQYVHMLLQKHASGSKKLLEFGSGTGRHATFLAQTGYSIYGIERSHKMIAHANSHLLQMPLNIKENLRFCQGDIRTIRIPEQFDAVIALFHVMSYQLTNEDLHNVFACAKAHLKSGGVFLFDCWYGPGVLSDPPTVRVKRFEDQKIAVTRIAEPVLHANENYVDVNYQILISDKATTRLEEFHECHQMRYLFTPEIREFFFRAGMRFVTFYEDLTEKPPAANTWNAYFIGNVETA
jgi:SAM-dependent methyltransferase